ELGGRILGETPKTFENLTPALGALVAITKPGFQPVSRPIDLKAGATAELRASLKASQKFGSLRVTVVGLWAEVHFGGKNLGRHATGTGLQTFQLPVGRQQIRLINPVAKKQKTITVDIRERKTTNVTTSLD
ncbi:MAG: hypothetical protein H0X17_08120, partial [Deltaproteobacteria bacterium]|nr:hypothetical protein [Deltaproteobacteria bacterium]